MKAESYKEWNWAYGWNAQGEEWGWGRQLGSVPAQTDPDLLSGGRWCSETIRYIPLKESEIKAPSSMLIIADKAGGREYDDGNVDVFVAASAVNQVVWKPFSAAWEEDEHHVHWMGMRSRCVRSRRCIRLGKWLAAGIEPTKASKGSTRAPRHFKPVFLDEGYSP